MPTHRNEAIDVIKGFLILCVITGHILLGSLDDNIIRYVIYSFHMPIFMFMSGYMINLNKLSTQPIKDICLKYWNRMLKMWLVAFVIFTAYQLLHSLTLHKLLRLLYNPWYHLWYVPTLFSYIIICRLLFSRVNAKVSYLTLASIGLLYIITTNATHLPLPRWCDCTQLPFFALGLLLRNVEVKDRKPQFIYIAVFFVIIAITRYLNIQSYGIIEMISLMAAIAFCIYPMIARDSLPHSKVLSYIGRNSLNIYLWHMIPVVVMKDLISNTTLYYSLSFILLVSFLLFVKFVKQR